MKKEILCFCAAMIALAIVFSCGDTGFAQETNKNRQPRQQLARNHDIHILLIFGSNDPKIRKSLKISQNALVEMFSESGLSDPNATNIVDDEYTLIKFPAASFTVLEGNDANRERILQECKVLNQKAGNQGAVFVYYLGHGAMHPNGPQRFSHAFFPQAGNVAGQANEHVFRDEIMALLTSKPHRFVGLVSDSCSVFLDMEPVERAAAEPLIGRHIYNISALLAFANGKINVNSSDPDKRGAKNRKGQMAFGTTSCGFFFSNAFASYFGNLSKYNGTFTILDMQNALKEIQDQTDTLYSAAVDYFSEQKDRSSTAEDLISQGRQDIRVYQMSFPQVRPRGGASLFRRGRR